MSKESKPADRWRQVFASGHDRHPDFCPGCGYYPVVNGSIHRNDCTAIQMRRTEAVRAADGSTGPTQ